MLRISKRISSKVAKEGTTPIPDQAIMPDDESTSSCKGVTDANMRQSDQLPPRYSQAKKVDKACVLRVASVIKKTIPLLEAVMGAHTKNESTSLSIHPSFLSSIQIESVVEGVTMSRSPPDKHGYEG